MSDHLDQPEGAIKRNFIDESDVEGHSIRRDAEGEGSARRGADLGEGQHKRNAFPDDGSDDVEGHSIRRDGEGVRSSFNDGDPAPGGDGFTRKVGPGEGHSSRQ